VKSKQMRLPYLRRTLDISHSEARVESLALLFKLFYRVSPLSSTSPASNTSLYSREISS
jgi:hypothetical protein